MIDGSVLQSVQRYFEKKSRVVVKMVVRNSTINNYTDPAFLVSVCPFISGGGLLPYITETGRCHCELSSSLVWDMV